MKKSAQKTRPQLLSDRETVDATLRFIAQRGWRQTDGDFFSALVTHLAESLGVAFATVDRVTSERMEKVQTVSFFVHGAISHGVEYELPGSPCLKVLENEFCYYARGIRKTFPDFSILHELKAEGYAGIALWGDRDRPIGLIAVADTKPLKNAELIETVLQIVAMRASAELERRIMMERQEFDRQRFEDFASSTSDWFWEMDENLRFSYFSDRFTKNTGVPVDRLLGKTREESGVESLTDPDLYRSHLRDLAEHRPFRNFTHGRKRPDGTQVFLSISGQPWFDEDGVFKGYRGVGRDITEQIEAEKQRDTALNEAQRANMAKSRFLANMSHDLRTPLNAILGFSDILREQLLGPLENRRYREYADDIHNSASYLLELVNDLLDISSIEAGKTKLFLEPIAVPDLIEDCFQNFIARAREKRLTVSIDVPRDLPTMVADKRALKQILLNLITNAIKFTPAEGTISIRAGLTESETRITIADTGPGIESERLPMITNPFTRGERNPLDSEKGWGLGLAIAKALVDLHEGRLEIDSVVGEGTSITISLPRRDTMPSLPFGQEPATASG